MARHPSFVVLVPEPCKRRVRAGPVCGGCPGRHTAQGPAEAAGRETREPSHLSLRESSSGSRCWRRGLARRRRTPRHLGSRGTSWQSSDVARPRRPPRLLPRADPGTGPPRTRQRRGTCERARCASAQPFGVPSARVQLAGHALTGVRSSSSRRGGPRTTGTRSLCCPTRPLPRPAQRDRGSAWRGRAARRPLRSCRSP